MGSATVGASPLRSAFALSTSAMMSLSLMNTEAGAAVCAHAGAATAVAMIVKAASCARMKSSRYLFCGAAHDRAGERSTQVPIVPLLLAPASWATNIAAAQSTESIAMTTPIALHDITIHPV